MPFVSVAFAARVERLDCQFLEECAHVIRNSTPDVLIERVAGGVAAYTGPNSPLNKVAGLGFGGDVMTADLERLEAEFDRRSTPLRIEVATLAEPQVARMLSRRGYVVQGIENVLVHDLAHLPTVQPGIDVAPAQPDEAELWLDTVVTGFANPDTQGVVSHESYPRDALERVIRELTGARGFERWLARRSGVVAGAGSLRIADGVAQFCGASTLPELRRQGVQSAFLAARLKRAKDAGCEFALVTTQPGSKSQQNVERFGFALAYSRIVFERDGVAAR